VTRFEPKARGFKPKGRGLNDLPLYYTIPEAARLMRREVESARKWLKRAGLVIHRGGRPCVSTAHLLAEFPEVRQRMFDGE
jgi:hypothetical protein